MGRQKAVIKA
ncbi:hypothetical protein ACH57_20950, partial [Salmonella enterica subsp. enterica serovar Typhimurium]